ncbi:hypothetical protein MMC18_007430 [Xylographa bjoerkii]|nr:hypothetical protein [Xylographa bjoerkii]
MRDRRGIAQKVLEEKEQLRQRKDVFNNLVVQEEERRFDEFWDRLDRGHLRVWELLKKEEDIASGRNLCIPSYIREDAISILLEKLDEQLRSLEQLQNRTEEVCKFFEKFDAINAANGAAALSNATQALPRTEVPLIINGACNSPINARHDFGAEIDGGIDEDEAIRRGLRIRRGPADRTIFFAANQTTTHAVGRARVKLTFVKGSKKTTKCWLYVFRNLHPLLFIGLPLLESTQTLSHHRNRLQERPASDAPDAIVNLISLSSKPKRRIPLQIAGQLEHVNADSMSDLDLMSNSYAKARGLVIDRSRAVRKRIRMVNGKMAETIGQTTETVTLPDGTTFKRTFNILPGLRCNVLLGEGALEAMELFQLFSASFIDVLTRARLLEVNGIASLGPVGQWVAHKLCRGKYAGGNDHQPSVQKQVENGLCAELARHEAVEARIKASTLDEPTKQAALAHENRLTDARYAELVGRREALQRPGAFR